jgi:hypothetical protein
VADTKDDAQAALRALCEEHGLERGHIFEHWKGGLYVITALSVAEDTLEPLVTYRSNSKGTESTRRLAVFVEELARGEGRIPRFRRIQL